MDYYLNLQNTGYKIVKQIISPDKEASIYLNMFNRRWLIKSEGPEDSYLSDEDLNYLDIYCDQNSVLSDIENNTLNRTRSTG